jgi:bacterioferritin (cytochrome b1)
VRPSASLRLSRREVAASALVSGGAGVMALAEEAVASQTPAATPAQALGATLSLELLAVFAYRRIASHPGLTPLVTQVVNKYLLHEQQHVQALTDQLARLGGTPPSPLADVTAADAILSAHGGMGSFSALHSQRDCLKILQQVEAVVEGGYFLAIAQVADPAIVRTFAEIMGTEAQHSTSLTGLLHPGGIDRAVPYAFVEGKQH